MLQYLKTQISANQELLILLDEAQKVPELLMEVFLNEYPNSSKGYIVCRTERAFQISKRVTAIPWQELPTLIF